MPQENNSAPVDKASLAGLNKRQQVAKANKQIFIWVAVASSLLAVALVLSQFLVKQALFNARIISKMQTTNSTLEKNIKNVDKLKENVDLLVANEALGSQKLADESSSLQVILDALPTSGDATTFANSLYSRVLPVSGVEIASLSVGEQGGSSFAGETASSDSDSLPEPQMLKFAAELKGSQDQLRDTLLGMEKVIRPIHVTHLSVDASKDGMSMKVDGNTYYVSKTTVKLGKKMEKP